MISGQAGTASSKSSEKQNSCVDGEETPCLSRLRSVTVPHIPTEDRKMNWDKPERKSTGASYTGVLKCGTVVRRGPHWNKQLYKDQDVGCEGGFRTGIVLTDTAQNNWAPVKWESNGQVHFYRWGVRELLTDDSPRYDITIVSHREKKIDFTGVSTAQILRRIVYPRWVGFKLDVLRVGDICTISQSFQVDLHLTMTWKAGPYDNYLYLLSKKDPLWEPQWQPRVYFPNAKQIGTFEYMANCDSRKYNTVYIGNELWVTVTLDLELMLTELFEMQSFPFDCQDLTLEIQSRDSTNKIKLVPLPILREDYLPEQTNTSKLFLNVRRNTFTDQEWKFKNTILEIKETDPEDDAFGLKFSKVIVRFKLKRLWMMYLFRVIMVLSLLSCGSLSSFFISYDHIGERLNLGVAFVLTTVAFLLVVSQWTPKIPYLTILDKYALIVLMFMLCILLHSALSAPSLTNDEAEEKLYSGWYVLANESTKDITVMCADSRESDTTNWSMHGFVIALVFIHCFFMGWAYKLREQEVKKLLLSSKSLEVIGVEKNVSDLKITYVENNTKNVYMANEKVEGGWFHRPIRAREVEVPPLTESFFEGKKDVLIFSCSRRREVASSSIMSKINLLGTTGSTGYEEDVNTIIEIFDKLNIEFEVYDGRGLMPDSDYTIADAVQASSEFKEFPQVYVRRHFLGGLRKIEELERTNTLANSILQGADLEDHRKHELLLAFQRNQSALDVDPLQAEIRSSSEIKYVSSPGSSKHENIDYYDMNS